MLQSEFYCKLAKAKMKQDELKHHGIIGQKWGIRRFQEKDGTYTQAGRERYGIGQPRESKDDDISEERIGSATVTALALAAGITGVQIGVIGIHDAVISKQIKNYEAHRATEETDPVTGLKLKSDKDADIKDDMKFINREIKYGLFGDDNGSTENCMLCTTALDLKRRGYDVKAGKVKEGFYAADLKKWYKEDLQPKIGHYKDVLERLEKEPDGSYGNFMVYWKEGGGHSMFYRIENGKPVIYDAQSNKKYTINEISRHANTVLPGHCFVRTDNLTPDYEYLKKEGLIA